MKPVIRVLGYSLGISAFLVSIMLVERVGVENQYWITMFRHLVLYQDLYAFAPYVAILLLALLPSVRQIGIHAAGLCGAHPLPVAALTSALVAVGALQIYQAHPLSMDEYAVLFQSQIFATGHLAGQFPPILLDWLIPPAIQGKFLKPDSRLGAVAAAYWPGFSLLLTPFTLLGAPWLLNPIIAGATVLVLHRIGLVLFGDRESAGYIALLTIASPAITINAMSFYAMPAHLLANAVYILLLLKPTVPKALLAGLVGSFALVLHSPIPHMFFSIGWILWLAFQPGGRKMVGALALGYLPLCLLIGFGWALFLDRLELVTWYGKTIAPSGIVESLLSRLENILEWLFEPTIALHVLNFGKLWLWAVPALIVVAILGGWRLRHERGRWVAIAASGLLTYVGYLYIPFDQGHGWGYRYFHQAWMVLPLFAVAALRAPPQPALAGYLAASAVLSLALLTPFQTLQLRTFVARHLGQLPAFANEARVVFVNPARGYYAWDLVQNDPFLRNPVILLLSRGEPADRALMAKVFPRYALLHSDPRASQWGVTSRASQAGTN